MLKILYNKLVRIRISKLHLTPKIPMAYSTALSSSVVALQGCFSRFQHLFTFTTEKFVVLKDWRLGMLLRVFQLVILGYVLYDITQKSSYLLQEIPKGVVTPWVSLTEELRRGSIESQEREFNNGSLSYCVNNSDYNYRWHDIGYKNFKCVMMDPLVEMIAGENFFFVTTYIRLDKAYFVSANGTQDCAKTNLAEIPNRATLLNQLNAMCLYHTVDQYFLISPENLTIEFSHHYYTSIVENRASVSETIVLAPGYKEGGEMRFASGATVSASMNELLDLAGVDLDKPLNEQPNQQDVDKRVLSTSEEFASRYPRVRLSGVTLVMHFKYYLRSLAPLKYRNKGGTNPSAVICVVEVEPQYGWAVRGAQVQQRITDAHDPYFMDPRRVPVREEPTLEGIQADFQRHGVELSFQVSGNVGEFDFFSLVDALVSGAVLLSIAQLIVTYIALYGLGLSSKLYTEFMREQIDWRKEYARFAAQSLVAGAAFKSYDKNGSRVLERREIYSSLTDVLDRAVDRDKIALLTDFLMRQGEEDVDVSKGVMDEEATVMISTISIGEWIDIFTAERAQLSSLERLIEHEYTDKKVREMLVRLAEGEHLRGLSVQTNEQLSLVARHPDILNEYSSVELQGAVEHSDKQESSTRGLIDGKRD